MAQIATLALMIGGEGVFRLFGGVCTFPKIATRRLAIHRTLWHRTLLLLSLILLVRAHLLLHFFHRAAQRSAARARQLPQGSGF